MIDSNIDTHITTHAVTSAATRWHFFVDERALCQTVVDRIIALANRTIAQQHAFHIVLAGGNTPRAIYQQLRTASTDWRAWHIYFGDERCLPEGDSERNDSMAHDTLLTHVPIPAAQIHAIPAQLTTAECLARYNALLANIEQFDLVLLGLGEDGHTASLFPDHDWGDYPTAPATLAVHHAPKPPANRISLSAQRLSRTQQLWFLVSGSNKKTAIQRWQSGEKIPASAIQAPSGVDVFIAEH